MTKCIFLQIRIQYQRKVEVNSIRIDDIDVTIPKKAAVNGGGKFTQNPIQDLAVGVGLDKPHQLPSKYVKTVVANDRLMARVDRQNGPVPLELDVAMNHSFAGWSPDRGPSKPQTAEAAVPGDEKPPGCKGGQFHKIKTQGLH